MKMSNLWDFNGDLTTYSDIKSLVQATGVKIAVETGIGSGDTTQRFGELFDWVHTIDCDEDKVKSAGERFSGKANIRCYLGDSRNVMDAVLPNLRGLVFLYLDAHGPTEPLGEEINVIAKHLADRAIIVIDDFLVPGDDRFCGAYKYENIKSNLEGAYPGGYKCFYSGSVATRAQYPTGRLFVVPAGVKLGEGMIVERNGIWRLSSE
jgi:hypothetical protein